MRSREITGGCFGYITLSHIIIFHTPYSIPQYEVQERTQQFLAIQEIGEMRQYNATELVQTLVEKIADISEVFEENSNSKLPSVSFNHFVLMLQDPLYLSCDHLLLDKTSFQCCLIIHIKDFM